MLFADFDNLLNTFFSSQGAFLILIIHYYRMLSFMKQKNLFQSTYIKFYSIVLHNTYIDYRPVFPNVGPALHRGGGQLVVKGGNSKMDM